MRHYFDFCAAATPYFDRMRRAETPFAPEAVDRLQRAGWSRSTTDEWCHLHPPGGVSLPEQGWKIHVSSTPGEAKRVLSEVIEYCETRELSFKFLRSEELLLQTSSKSADRAACGKFITIYPVDTLAFGETLRGLNARIGGEPGPYVLTDVRYEQGPLYARYGAFVSRRAADDNGVRVECIQHPDGRLVPDSRAPVFRPPDWVEIPSVLAASVESRRAGAPTDFPYRPVQALHFSNGGGVYRAIDRRDGSTVLLKEGRPHAGLDDRLDDAVTRLEREYEALTRLAHLDGIPDVHDIRRGHEHMYLVTAFVDAPTLGAEIERRNPLFDGPDAMPAPEYAEWAHRVFARIERLLDDVHEAGVTYGDLHPGNIFVDADDNVTFIDFESAAASADDVVQAIGAPGFRAPAGMGGVAADRFGLGCIWFHMYVPDTLPLGWGTDRVARAIEIATSTFGVTSHAAEHALTLLGTTSAEIGRPGPAAGDDLDHTVDQLITALVDAATPTRTDRLFPGDPMQFLSPAGGVSIGWGAAGVLDSLAHIAPDRIRPEWIDWLWRRTDAAPNLGPGLVDGLAGVAITAARFGERDRAHRLLDAAIDRVDTREAPTLVSGIAGIGLAALGIADGRDSEPWHRAVELADAATASVEADERLAPGLGYGAAGVALLQLRLGIAADADRRIDIAEQLLLGDIERLLSPSDQRPVPRVPGLLFTGGLLLCALELTARRPDSRVAGHLAGLVEQLAPRLVRSPGLFQGRAGAIVALAAAAARDEVADLDRAGERAGELLAQHLADLDLYVVRRPDGVGTLGDFGVRLSCDLATGSVGVAAALHTVAHGGAIPLLEIGR